jgi:ATP-dependent helicase YprA (DUF1998 family)
MTTITLNVASTIVLPDGRTALVLDGPVPAATAVKAIAQTPTIQRTPRKPKARKPLVGKELAKQVAFWSGKASDAQIRRIKEAGTRKHGKTLATMTALEARAELGRLNPAAKLSVIPQEVLDAIKA